MFGAGLRRAEAVRIRVKDLEFDESQIVVRDPKGHKQRITLFPEARRAFATDLMQRGYDIRTVQKLLGHQHLSTTEKYVFPLDNYKQRLFRGSRVMA